MSYSTLFKINEEYKKEDEIEYRNSWLFSPIVFDELFWKYMKKESISPYSGDKIGLISANMFGGNVFSKLNEIMNNSSNMNDRILWELVNQAFFEKKDYDLISDSIMYGIEEYLKLNDRDYGEHIIERWKELASDIKNSESTYIVHKNTSVDDTIEYLFSKYDEEEGEYLNCPINESEFCNKHEFALIEDGKIKFQVLSDRFKKGE